MLILFILTVITFFPLFQSCNSGSGSDSTSGFSVTGNENTLYDEEKASDALEEILSNGNPENEPDKILLNNTSDSIAALVHHFYREKNYIPQWNGAEPGEEARAFLDELESLPSHGLDTADFSVGDLKQSFRGIYNDGEIDYSQLAKTEIALTAHYFRLARQIGKGRIEGGKYLDNWHIKPEEVNKLKNLETALEEGVGEALHELEPDYRQYALLQEKLEQYIEVAQNGGWNTVALDKPVKPGDSASAVIDVRKRLHAETGKGGDLENPVFDKALQEEIKNFRYRFNLPDKDEPVIDEAVAEAMNEPVEERIRVLNLNLDRCRWLTEPMGETYILVNIPEYRMRVIENGKPALAMKVIVGKEMNKTPVFSDSMEYLEFAPFWNVPASIANEEILPHAQEDPLYLENRHYEVVAGWGDNANVVPAEEVDWENLKVEEFPYRIRQKPGHWNSLGKVKFMFPNNKAIYLHDTPADYLFSESEREFSHGCVRVEHPDQLANYLLPDYSEREISSLLDSNERTVIPLEKKIPVYIVYFTAIVDREGNLRFLEDIYGMDKVQRQAL